MGNSGIHSGINSGRQGAPKGFSGILPGLPEGSQSDPKERPLGAKCAATGPTGISMGVKKGPQSSQGGQNRRRAARGRGGWVRHRGPGPPGWFGAARRWAWGGMGPPKEGPQGEKSQNYIHINEIYTNSRSTAIERPASINTIITRNVGVKSVCLVALNPHSSNEQRQHFCKSCRFSRKLLILVNILSIFSRCGSVPLSCFLYDSFFPDR